MQDILEYRKFYGHVQFSASDGIFYGQLIGIDSLVSFEGDTVQSLKQSFRDAVDDYLDTCKRLNKEPDKTYKGSFNVRIPSALHRQAAQVAAIKKITLNDFVRYAIDETVTKEIQVAGKKKRLVVK